MSNIFKCECGFEKRTSDNVIMTGVCSSCGGGGKSELLRHVDDGNTGETSDPKRYSSVQSPYPCRECPRGAMLCTRHDINLRPASTVHASTVHECDVCGLVDERGNHPLSDMPPRENFPKDHRFVLENPDRLDFIIESQKYRIARLLQNNWVEAYQEALGEELEDTRHFRELTQSEKKLWFSYSRLMIGSIKELQFDLLTGRERDLLRELLDSRVTDLREEDDEASGYIADDLENIYSKLNL